MLHNFDIPSLFKFIDKQRKLIVYQAVYCPASQEWQWRRVLLTIVK